MPFNTRSYLLSTNDGACAGHHFGTSRDYSCVNYTAGASMLAGKVLEFDLE